MKLMTQKQCLAWGEILFVGFVVAACLFGCSIFSNTTPKSEIRVARKGLDGQGKAQELNLAEMAGIWMQGAFTIRIRQEFEDSEGAELMVKQEIDITNISEKPTAALEVAIARAEAAEKTVTELSDTVRKLAPLAIGLPAIPDVTINQGVKADDKATTGVENP